MPVDDAKDFTSFLSDLEIARLGVRMEDTEILEGVNSFKRAV